MSASDAVIASQTATTGGRKFDGGKTQFGLMPPFALTEFADVLTYGAKKYNPENWKWVPDAKRRYFDAAMRHMWAWKCAVKNDPETGLHHMAHAMCCLAFIIDIEMDPSIINDINNPNSEVNLK
jgi:hypothetical protein